MDESAISTQRGHHAAEARSSRATTSGVVVDIAGVPVLLRASDAQRAAAMVELMERLPPTNRRPMASLVFTDRPDPWPQREPDEVHDDLLVWRGTGDETRDLVLAHATGLTVTVTGTDAHIGGECEWLGVGFRRLFPLALCPVLAPHDRILLHGGAFVVPVGAFLALGPTGSGKSTLVLAADRAGWRCLADDLVVLRLDRGLEVQGIPRPLAAPADVVVTTDHDARAQALPDDHRGRFLLTDLRLADGWFPVAGTLLVGHSERAEGELLGVPGRETLLAAIGCFHGAGQPALLRRAYPYLASLGRLPAWRLLHGAEPSSRLDAAVTHLERASGELGAASSNLP